MGRKIIFCNCNGGRYEPERLLNIENNLIKANTDLLKISDLCGMSVLEKANLGGVFTKNEEYLIIACNSRSLKLLLENAGINTGDYNIRFINFLQSDDEEINKEVRLFMNNDNIAHRSIVEEIRHTSDWIPWFPVIDYSRCSACGQCADFCLFGVYEKSEEKVTVINPQGCKIHCPACARICPKTAIVFPKFKDGGAISGSDIIDEISEQKRQAEDINTILKGDIYSALELRKKKRKSIILESAMNKAVEERLDALNKRNPETR